MNPALLALVGIVLVFFSLLSLPKVKNKWCPVSIITFGVMLIVVSWWPPEPLFYKLDGKKYIVESGNIVKSAETPKIYFWKPNGEIRSYSTLYDTLEWVPSGRTLPGMNVVFAMKGSPKKAEELRALRDSVNPIDTLQSELESKPRCSRLRAIVMRYDPIVRPVSAPFLRPKWAKEVELK